MKMLHHLVAFWVLSGMINCTAQPVTTTDREVGGPCEGCEALFEFGERELSWRDTLPGFGMETPQLIVTGVVYQPDGKTPAANVIVYAYHTDRQGRYTPKPNATAWARRHGKHRGWVRTQEDGQYAFYTFRPAAYPGRDTPEHIHLTVKPPGYVPYYVDEIEFTDDPLLTPALRSQHVRRGGPGVVTPLRIAEGWTVRRDIILGMHIPGYEQ